MGFVVIVHPAAREIEPVEKFGIGQPVSRFEDPRLVRGGGRYVDDIVLPRMAFGYVLRSPHAHARIRSIDDRGEGGARRARGLDRRRLGGVRLGRPAGAGRTRSGATAARCTARAFRRWSATGCAGSAITSPSWWRRPAQAEDAAELIEVDYEPLPAVVSTAEARAPGAPLVWDDCPDNICFVHLEGDKAATDAAFAARRTSWCASPSSSIASPP